MTLIEFAATFLIIGSGLGFWLGDIVSTRRWQNEMIERRIYSTRH